MLSRKPWKADRRNGMDYRVGDWGAFLATRERGRRVREAIEECLNRANPGETVEIDFSGVDAVTVSFGDESIAKLVIAREAGDFADRGMVIVGANDEVTETLETVLSRRKLAAATVDDGHSVVAIGDKGWVPATLEAAVDLKVFSAADLAAKLGLTPQAANNRLKTLVASGAVARELTVPERGGKEFSYRTVTV
jgi:hypothetical protein